MRRDYNTWGANMAFGNAAFLVLEAVGTTLLVSYGFVYAALAVLITPQVKHRPHHMNITRAFVFGTLLTVVPASLLAAPSSLCSGDEETIFSCRTKRKTYEICASKGLSAASGYMQYRAGSNGKVEFVFPSQRMAPVGHFRFALLARGAQLTFQNGEFTYEIVEPLIGKTTIWVSHGNGGATQAAECQNFTESLTLTTTQNRFKNLGISE